MFSTIIATFFFLGVVFARELPICTENEEYQDCGTECPQTCLDLFEPRQCSDVCVQGCFCKAGFVRAGETGSCVPRESCKNVLQCRVNEIYSDCATLCPLTCQDTQPKACPDVCLEGCICKEGYIRSVTGGPCVAKETCEAKFYI